MISHFFPGYMPAIETPRLLLRKLTMQDAEDIFEYGKDPEVAEHVLWSAYRSIGEARAYVRYMQRRYRNTQAASWGIEHLGTRKIIGTIGYMSIQDDNSVAEVGYSLSHDYWNRGIMTEALRAVVEYSFDVLRLNRVEAMHETDNPASGIVMAKCGFTHEGTLRQKLFNKGRFVDVEICAILREDYKRIYHH